MPTLQNNAVADYRAEVRRSGLTRDEIEVIVQKIAGYTLAEIASMLSAKEDYVRECLASGLNKLPPSWMRAYEHEMARPRGKRYRMVHASQVEAIV